MKDKKELSTNEDSSALRDVSDLVYGGTPQEQMVRTQIYLTRAEHGFLQGEAARRGEAMSAVIRRIIDEKMMIPEDAWSNNPLLQPTAVDPEWDGPEDGSLNHDHYAFGAPKKYKKIRGKWLLKTEDET